ncbi:hypothetical protein MRX96_021152 [Rhipicephalus microplus]
MSTVPPGEGRREIRKRWRGDLGQSGGCGNEHERKTQKSVLIEARPRELAESSQLCKARCLIGKNAAQADSDRWPLCTHTAAVPLARERPPPCYRDTTYSSLPTGVTATDL